MIVKTIFQQGLLWLIVFCMALTEAKEFGYKESTRYLIKNINVVEVSEIQVPLNKDHIHQEYEFQNTDFMEHTLIPTPPITPSKTPHKLSAILACYNASWSAADALKNLIKVNDDMLFEIIAVDNNSVDETYNVLLSVDDPRIIVKSLSDATDYSSTLKYAISQTSGENILVLEPDIASQLDNLPEVLEQISVQQSPVVFLSRTHKEEFANRFFTNILRILISMLFHIKVKDPFPLGFFCSGSLLRNMSKHDYRIDFRVALLAYMSRYNIRPIELPLSDYRQYGVIKSNLLLRMSQILRIPQISKVLVKIKKP